jgi:hypothetical protein
MYKLKSSETNMSAMFNDGSAEMKFSSGSELVFFGPSTWQPLYVKEARVAHVSQVYYSAPTNFSKPVSIY